MIFFTIFGIIFKSFLFLIENVFANNIFALEIAFCWFTWVGVLGNKLKHIFMAQKKVKKIPLNIYKLHQPNLRIIFVLLYLTCFITILFLLKASRSFRTVSLKQLYGELINFFSPLDFGQQLCTILFGLTLIYLAILLTKGLKNFIFKELIKVHLYFCNTDIYFDSFLLPMSLHCHMTFENAVERFFSSKVKFLNTPWFYNFVCFLVENLVLILILTLVSFDIYFNDFVLTKVFYMLPLCFLYSQYLYMSKFVISKDMLLDSWINTYLYTKIVFEDENIIIFATGKEIDLEILESINSYIEKGFKAY